MKRCNQESTQNTATVPLASTTVVADQQPLTSSTDQQPPASTTIAADQQSLTSTADQQPPASTTVVADQQPLASTTIIQTSKCIRRCKQLPSSKNYLKRKYLNLYRTITDGLRLTDRHIDAANQILSD